MTSIRVELELADGTFTTRMLNAGQTIRQFEAQVAKTNPAMKALHASGGQVIKSMEGADKSTKSFMGSLRDISVVLGVASLAMSKISGISRSWVGDIVRINMEMERLNYQMQAMSNSSDPIKEAADNVAYLRDRALEMPFSLKAITDGFVKMKATGSDPLNGSLQALADGVAAAGGTDESFKRSILAVSQISGKGVLQMEELRQQLGESMPRAVELMARSMGIGMAQLIQEISTGTVQAKPALQAFYDELDRTYGGRALMMMQTFSGQLQKTKSMLETLSSTGTLKTEFFDGALMEQLRDLNAFLESDNAKKFADQLGNGLASGVRAVRSLIDTVIDLRQEFVRLGTVITVGAGIAIIGKTMIGVAAHIATVRLQLSLLGPTFVSSLAQMRLFGIAAASTGGTVTALRAGVMGLGLAVKGLFAGAAALAPIIAVVGIAAFTAAEYFGLLSDKTKEAYDSLVEYGAESRAVAKQIIADQEASLKATVRNLTLQSRGDTGYKPLLEAKAELRKFQADSAALIAKAGEREDAEILQNTQDQLNKANTVVQGIYDAEANARTERHKKEIKDAQEAGQSLNKVRERHELEWSAAQLSVYEARAKITKEMLEKEQAVEKTLLGDQLTQSQIKVRFLQEQLVKENASIRTYEFQGLDKMQKPTSEALLFDKGTAYLEKLTAQAKGLQEELDGGFRALGQLNAELEQGKFGNTQDENVQDQNKVIVAKAQELEILEKQAKVKKDNDRLLGNGDDLIVKLTADIAGYRAEMSGLDGEVYELQEALKLGKIGPAEIPGVQAKIEQIMQLKVSAEQLKDKVDELNENAQLFKNGEANLAKINAEIKGMIAGLGDANEETAELAAAMEAGKFGPSAEEGVRRLIDSIEEASEAKEKLNVIMEGKKAFESDLQENAIKQAERLAEAQAEAAGNLNSSLSEIEKIKIRMEQGGYGGFGDTAKVQQAIIDVIKAIDNQGIALNEVGKAARDNAFGPQTNNSMNTVTTGLRTMLSVAQQLAGAFRGLVFPDGNMMGQPGLAPYGMNGDATGVTPSGTSRTGVKLSSIQASGGRSVDVDAAYAANFQGFIRELEASGYKISSLGGYNYRNIAGTGKLSEHAFGRSIDINPDQNPDTGRGGALVTDMPANVSDMARKYGLDWGGDWTSKKDAMHFEVSKALKAQVAANGGVNPAGTAPASDLTMPTTAPVEYSLQAVKAQADYVAAQKVLTAEYERQLALEPEINKLDSSNERKKSLEELKKGALDANKPIEDLGKNLKNLQDKITTGGFGKGSSLDVNAAEYKELTAAAIAFDKAEKARGLRADANRDVLSAGLKFKQRELDLAREAADAMARIKNPNATVASAGYRELEQQLDEYVADVRAADGATTESIAAAVAYRGQLLGQLRSKEGLEEAAALAKKNVDGRMSLMNTTQARRAAMEQEIAAIDQMVADFQGSEEAKVMIVQQAEIRKAQIRQAYGEKVSPIEGQMKQWGDIQENLAQASTQWMDSIAGGMTDLIMGTGDLKSAIQGILRDLINMGIKKMISSMFTGAKGAAPVAGAPAAGGKAGMFSKGAPGGAPSPATKLMTGGKAGVAHTGGIVGAAGLASRFVSGAAFNGAPRFHTGGIIGGPRMSMNEVPIIAQKGEGVFTEGQMKAMGGRGGPTNISVNTPVTVNANGGKPSENADLAKQVGRQVEQTMRGVVVDEIMKQMRPGNMLNNKRM